MQRRVGLDFVRCGMSGDVSAVCPRRLRERSGSERVLLEAKVVSDRVRSKCVVERGLVLGEVLEAGPAAEHHDGVGIERGARVVICHTGRHEVDEMPPEVEHVHTDPFDVEALRGTLAVRRFDAIIAIYRRLRDVAIVARELTHRLITVGGIPVSHGYMVPEACTPGGVPLPTREDDRRASGMSPVE